jgi:glycosyltransferase involved in cell wall biosynthesis
MTAVLAAWIAQRKSARLYLDIRDIFVDNIADVLPFWVAGPAKLLFSQVESWTMRRADKINLVSRGFESYFRARYPNQLFSWFTNGVDDEFIALEPYESKPRQDDGITILYAGNIGEGQCLHCILPGLALALGDRVRFILIGDGGRKKALQRALEAAKVGNVEIRDPMSRAQLIGEYQLADVLFLHLGAHPALEMVLPSKLFEYAALGKPVLAGVAGYAAQFVREEINNAAVFPPCDVPGAVSALNSLQIADRPRAGFIAKFARANIARDMADDILSLQEREA